MKLYKELIIDIQRAHNFQFAHIFQRTEKERCLPNSLYGIMALIQNSLSIVWEMIIRDQFSWLTWLKDYRKYISKVLYLKTNVSSPSWNYSRSRSSFQRRKYYYYFNGYKKAFEREFNIPSKF